MKRNKDGSQEPIAHDLPLSGISQRKRGAYNLRLSGKYRVRLQLNVDNLLDEDKLPVIGADQIRAYRYVFQTRGAGASRAR